MAKLVFKNGPFAGKSVHLVSGKSLIIGRNPDLPLPLPDIKLSRRHCEFEIEGERCVLKDLGSTNGTFVNGKRLTAPVALKDGDRILAGDTELELLPAGHATTGFQFDAVDSDPFGGFEESVPMPDGADAQQATGPRLATPTPPLPPALATALQEMARPLPPEPPAIKLAQAPVTPLKIEFCDLCGGSIPQHDVLEQRAQTIGGKLVCKECIARGTSGHPPVPANPPPSLNPESIEKALAGLDQQAVLVDTSDRGSSGSESTSIPAPGKAKPVEPPVPPALSDPFGDLDIIG